MYGIVLEKKKDKYCDRRTIYNGHYIKTIFLYERKSNHNHNVPKHCLLFQHKFHSFLYTSKFKSKTIFMTLNVIYCGF